MHIATLWKILTPLAFLAICAPASAQNVATFEVYAVPGCRQVGNTAPQSKKYTLADRACVNTAPIPGVDGRFLSYKGAKIPGVNASSCFFDVYPDKDCGGNYSGFENDAGNDGQCENLLQGFTGLRETFGGKSVRVSCRK